MKTDPVRAAVTSSSSSEEDELLDLSSSPQINMRVVLIQLVFKFHTIFSMRVGLKLYGAEITEEVLLVRWPFEQTGLFLFVFV